MYLPLRIPPPTDAPCRFDPDRFDCSRCEIAWTDCRFRLDESLRLASAIRKRVRAARILGFRPDDRQVEETARKLCALSPMPITPAYVANHLAPTPSPAMEPLQIAKVLRSSRHFRETSPGVFRLRPAGHVHQSDQLPQLSERLGGIVSAEQRHSGETVLAPLSQFKRLSSLKYGARRTPDVVVQKIDALIQVAEREHGLSVYEVYRIATIENASSFGVDVSSLRELFDAVGAHQIISSEPSLDLTLASVQTRDALVEANLGLVSKAAYAYADGRGLTFADLFQEGCIGLMKALERFDPYRGLRFSTYATLWIRQAITRAKYDKSRAIRLPVHVASAINAMLAQADCIELETGSAPTVATLSARIKRDPKSVVTLQAISRPIESIEYLTENGLDLDASSAVARGLPVPCEDPVAAFEDKNFTELMSEVLNTLTERERKILRSRYGLDDGRSQTLEEIGRCMKVTRERVRQIEAKALRKMRHPSRSSRLADFLREGAKAPQDKSLKRKRTPITTS